MATQLIRVSQGGAEELREITMVDSKAADLSSVDVEVSFGNRDDPSNTWNETSKSVSGNSIIFTVTVGGLGVQLDPGVYYVWVKVTDGTRVYIRMLDFIVTVK